MYSSGPPCLLPWLHCRLDERIMLLGRPKYVIYDVIVISIFTLSVPALL